MPPFYPNEIAAAEELVQRFNEGRYCILLAQMQSGKSNAFMLVGAEMVRLKMVERFVVISGNTEKALKEQAKKQDDFWDEYHMQLIDRREMGPREASDKKKEIKKKWTVKMGSDLAKDTEKYENTLFIWDESHYAQSNKQRPDKFFIRNGLQPDGSAMEGNNKILSVSATPFSELVDNGIEKQNKSVVFAQPGKDYIGARFMLENNLIKSWKSDFVPQLEECCRMLKPDNTRNKGIIRVSNKTEQTARDVAKSFGLECFLFDQSQPVKDLEEKLEDNKWCGVILVKGKLRMGTRIKKHHILWAFETYGGVNKMTTKTDTLLQGLFGRMCGYPESGSSKDITIYVPFAVLESDVFEQYANLMEHGHVAPCGPAMNVHKIKDNKTYPTIPDKVEIDLEDWETRKDLCRKDLYRKIKHYVLDTLTSKNDRWVDPLPPTPVPVVQDLTRFMKGLLRECEDEQLSEFIKFNNLDEDSHSGHKEQLETCWQNGTLLTNPGPSNGVRAHGKELRVWTEGKIMTMAKQCFREKKPLTVYLQYVTNIKTLQLETTKKEVFCRRNEDNDEVAANGAQPVTLPVETCTSIEAMKNAIKEGIRNAAAAQYLQVANRFESNATNDNRQWQGITLTTEVLMALEKGGEIYEEIKSEFKRKLEIKKPRGRRPTSLPTHLTRLSSIQW